MSTSTPARRPNVILIITDDQGFGDLGCHGNPVACTPCLDELHAQSVRLNDFHAAPMCTPTRAQLLTGLDAARAGAVNVSSGRTLLRPELSTLADSFRAGGYATGLFGKWHLGDNYPYRPQDRGFDESLWFPSSHISSVPDYWENDYFDDVYRHNGQLVRQTGYCTQVFFHAAKDWIDERLEADEPFFCYLPTNAPHGPLFVPPEDREAEEAYFAAHEDQLPDLKPQQRAAIVRFLAMIRNLDREVGQLRQWLRERDAEEDTLLIFMTDNGSTFGPLYYNAGMRGQKIDLWEGGHRVPCFLQWPNGGLGEPRDIDGLTQVQDMLPTLAEFCELPLPDRALDGLSLAPILRAGDAVPEDRTLFINYSRMPGEIDYPTPDGGTAIEPDGAAVLWRRWRLIRGTELYDLERDPLQQNNVIDQHPDLAADLRARLDAWWREVEPIANEPQRVIIGSDAENPMMLSACEWWDVFVDQQRQIRIAERRNSYWHLTVEQAGRYTFELRRWPRESGLKLREACPRTEVTDGVYVEGVAMPIGRARLRLGRQRWVQSVGEDDAAAIFTVDLQPGPVRLHTWFDDERGQPLSGAYYVYVERH